MMSDRIGVLLGGVLCQYDDAETVYNEPASDQVAAFLGHVNTIPRKYFHFLSLPEAAEGNGYDISVRAESLMVEKDPQGSGVIEDLLFAGQYSVCRIRIDDLTVTAYSSGGTLKIHDRVRLMVKRYIQLKGD